MKVLILFEIINCSVLIVARCGSAARERTRTQTQTVATTEFQQFLIKLVTIFSTFFAEIVKCGVFEWIVMCVKPLIGEESSIVH